MSDSQADKLHYVRIPKAQGGRAEMTRLTYVLAGKPYVDVHWSFADAGQAVAGKNPLKQFPFVETANGEVIYQTLAIMYHAARGTPVWPGDPKDFTQALAVAMTGYDLYQAFGAFAADDLPAKKKFEERRAPQFIDGLGAIYASRKFAIGETPTFADCIVYEAVAWCARRNEAFKRLYEASPNLVAFMSRFAALPKVREFMEKQAAARRVDDSV